MTENEKRAPLAAFIAVAVIFVFSGATALVYEVVWTRQLTTFFGSTLYGVATVLSAFMGGLALGSYLFGKRADKMQRPLAVYGLLEIGIGLAALAFPFALKATQPIIGSFYATGGEGTFVFYSLARFAIVFVLLLVPTTFMGATLPIMSKAVTTNLEVLGRRVGGLYALNTAGAVLGVFAAGFFLLENLGIFKTTMLAVALDILIGVGCIVLGKKFFLIDLAEEPPSAQPEVSVAPPPTEALRETESYSPKILRLVLLSYMVSGFVALAYQVCWTRSLIFSFDRLKSTTYSFSGMLLVFLLGLAIGSALMQAIVDRQRNLLRLYALIQAGIGLSGALSYFVLLMDLPALNEVTPDGTLIYWNAVANVLFKTAAAIGLPTLLMGMAFPVVTKIAVGSIHKLGIDIARVYALNTVGAIAGSFAAAFILIPVLGITGSLAFLVFVNLAVASVLMLANPLFHKNQRVVYTVGFAIVAVFVPGRIAFSDAKLQRIQENETIVHYEEGAMATISVVENNSGDRMIYVDDVGVAGTDKIMLTDQKSLAHVPMMLLGGEAKRILSVGFGSGGASYSYTLYPDIEEIHTIEIAPEVLRAAPALTDSNYGVIVDDALLSKAKAAKAHRIGGFRHPISDYVYTPAPGFKTFDPRLRVLIDDARSYLRFTDIEYDVIATDCTDLRYKSNANLYDLEYFTLCRERISDDGLVVVWMPLAGLSERGFKSALRTFQVVFPEMSVWYFTNQPTHYCLLIATKGSLKIDYDAVVKATGIPGIEADLQEIRLRDPDKLISSFVCDDRTLTEHLEGYPLNTEDHPIIEFEAPRYGYDSRPICENQGALYNIQVPVTDLVTGGSREAEDRIWQLQVANELIFQGHCWYREYDFRQACRLYMTAKKLVPFDQSIDYLLDFPELVRHFETSRMEPTYNTFVIGQGIAEVYLMQDRLAEAVTYANETLEVMPSPAQVAGAYPQDLRVRAYSLQAILARAYARRGAREKAVYHLGMARTFTDNEEQFDELESEVERMLEEGDTS